MKIVPAVDIKNGKCVRLFQGDYSKETVYGDDPVLMAQKWEKEGAEMLGEVSTKFKNKPYIWGVETEEKPVQRVSVLGEYCDGSRLGFYGNHFDVNSYGHAFGVRK